MDKYGLNEKWWLLEDALPDSIDKRGNALSLTPVASYRLSKLGVKYSIIEDFYDEKKMLEDEDVYFNEFTGWLKKFEDVIKNSVNYCKKESIHLPLAHSYRIKFFVDSVVIHSYMLSRFLDSVKPANIHYLRRSKTKNRCASIYGAFDDQVHIVSDIIHKLCEQRKIPFYLKESGSPEDEANNARGRWDLKAILKKPHLKSLYYFFKYKKFSKLVNTVTDRQLRILSLHAGCLPMDILIKDMIGSGDRVYFKNDDIISRIDAFVQKDVLDLNDLSRKNDLFVAEVKKDCQDAYISFLNNGSLLGWISDRCGVDVSEIVKPYFNDLIENIFLNNIVEYPVIKEFIKKEKIDYVVARSGSEIGSVSSLLAAEGGRVCFQHGCASFNSSSEDLHELATFDYYFSMHDEAEEEKKEALRTKRELLGNCKVLQAPYQIRTIKEKIGESRRDDNLIMYVPTKLFLGFRNYNMYLYPLTWYFELQKAVIDLLSRKRGLKFIFKSALGQDWCKDSIHLYIKDKKSNNISIYDGPLISPLKRAGRVILDFPSTGFYEAAAAGIPVISLYHELFKMRSSAINIFGKSLACFKDIDDAVKIIDNFLSSEPEQYTVDIAVSRNNAVDLLRNMVNPDAKNG